MLRSGVVDLRSFKTWLLLVGYVGVVSGLLVLMWYVVFVLLR